ncbi:MAG: hypothetical protein MPN21_00470 [Thermoanaerobaculia bacterium]|nr:hypothetical protein [Thermoanaerobaculia bacterium]
MSRQFFSGNSIEQAVMAAARHYGVDPERIAYTTRDKKHGFLNIRRRVVIEVDPDRPEVTAEKITGRSPEEEQIQSRRVSDATEESSAPENSDSGWDVGPTGFDEPTAAVNEETGVEEEADQAVDETYGAEAEPPIPADGADDESDREASNRGRGGRGSRGGRGRQGGKKKRTASEREGDRGSRQQDQRDEDNVRMYRGVQVDWKEEVELEGVSRELAAFEFAVERTLDVMDLEIEYTIVEGDIFKIEFSGEDADLLTEDDGRVLKAFEHVLPRIVRGLVGESHNCKVDCEGFRAEHEDQLVELAQSAADGVRDTGEAKVLQQMNPSDRRIIHLALVNDSEVETVSQGRGYMKRVRIQLLDED